MNMETPMYGYSPKGIACSEGFDIKHPNSSVKSVDMDKVKEAKGFLAGIGRENDFAEVGLDGYVLRI